MERLLFFSVTTCRPPLVPAPPDVDHGLGTVRVTVRTGNGNDTEELTTEKVQVTPR